MKTKNTETSFDIFAVYALTSEEMINVRGGHDDIPANPTQPPTKI